MSEKDKKWFVSRSFRLFEWLMNKGYEINVIGGENFQCLNKQPEIPAVLYFNHISSADPLIMAYLLITYLRNRFGNVIYTDSEDYTKLTGKKPHYIIGVKLAETVGFYMPRIIQPYRLEDERLSEKQKKELGDRSTQLANEFGKLLEEKLPAGATSVIAPESHRSEDGSLLPAEKGLGLIVKHSAMRNSRLSLPVGLAFADKYNYSRGLNYHPLHPKQINVSIGSPLDYDQILAQTQILTGKTEIYSFYDISHCLMVQLRDLLPDWMHGFYSQELLARTLNRDFELRMGPGRKPRVFDISTDTWFNN